MIPEKTTVTRPAMMQLNTDYLKFVERVDSLKEPFFAAGLFFDANHDALLVLDNQDGGGDKIWHKIPGGVTDKVFSSIDYLEALKTELEKMKYGTPMIERILKRESQNERRNSAERTMILEMVEETAYFPTEFHYVVDGYRYNWDTHQHDLWQVYFLVESVISPYSANIDRGIMKIADVRTAKAIDADIQKMRVCIPVEKLIETLGSRPHKVATKIILSKRSDFFLRKMNESIDPGTRDAFKKLSKKFAFASK